MGFVRGGVCESGWCVQLTYPRWGLKPPFLGMVESKLVVGDLIYTHPLWDGDASEACVCESLARDTRSGWMRGSGLSMVWCFGPNLVQRVTLARRIICAGGTPGGHGETGDARRAWVGGDVPVSVAHTFWSFVVYHCDKSRIYPPPRVNKEQRKRGLATISPPCR